MDNRQYKYSLDNGTEDTNTIEPLTKELEEESADIGESTSTKLDIDYRKGQSYSDGFYNGVLGITDSQYEAFIDKLFDVKYINGQLEFHEKKSTELQAEVQKILTDKDVAHQRIFQSENENTVLNWKLEEKEHEWQLLKDRLKSKEEEKKRIKPAYGILTVLLYIAVGFIFMAVDWAITKAYLELFFGSWESMIMAIGISLLAIIIKPSIDRVFEKPYIQEGRTLRNHTLLIVVSLVTLTALGMIGYSRNEVVGKDKFVREMESETTEGGLWIEENPDNSQTETTNTNSKLAIYEDFIQSPITAAIFVLISIIFALAGAIIMAIGFPVAREHMQIQRLTCKINKIRKLIENQFSQIEIIRTRIADNNTAKQYAAYELERMKDEGPLVDQIDYHRTRRANLWGQLYGKAAGREIAYYRYAHAIGKRHNLIGDLNVKVLGSQFLLGHHIRNGSLRGTGLRAINKNGSYGSNKYTNRTSNKEGYMHQQLRSIIDNNYIKSNGKG